jgi:hypothetical protein
MTTGASSCLPFLPFLSRGKARINLFFARRSVAGGLKATLHRTDRSEEAKEHARERLEEMGIDPDTV